MENKFIRLVLGKDIKIIELISLLKKVDTVSLDTETTIGQLMDTKLLSMQLAFESDKAYSIFIDCRYGFPVTVLNELKKKKWICHNAKFDYSIIKVNLGYSHNDVEDTMIMAQLTELGLSKEKGKYTLQNLVRKYVDEFAYSNQGNLFSVTTGKEIRTSFGYEDFTEEQITYGLRDVEYTLELFKHLSKELKDKQLEDVYYKVEKPFVLVLGDMWYNGIRLDAERWRKISTEVGDKIEKWREELKEVRDINWDSPKQVLSLFKEMGLNLSYIDKKTGMLKEGVNATVIKKIDDELVANYIRYKEMMKLYSSYGEKFLSNVESDGRIRSSFIQMVDTGRTASSSPNLQQIPREGDYRNCFIPQEGYSFVVADYSSQEVLLAADLYGEESIVRMMEEGKDMHLNTASLVYGETISDKKDLRRQIAKTIIFTILYGGGPSKIANQFSLPLSMAAQAVKKVKEIYPNIMKGLEDKYLSTLRNGYILTNSFSKRRIYIDKYDDLINLKNLVERYLLMGWDVRPDLYDKYYTQLSNIKRKSFNYPIQSSGADMSKLAGILLRDNLRLCSRDIRIILLAHDEWVIECKDEDIEFAKQLLKNCMQEASKKILKSTGAIVETVVSKHWTK